MKLQYTDYGIELSLKENSVHRLCIESPQAYAEIVQSLYQQCNGEEGNAILSDGVQPLEFDKYAEILLEPFSLQFDTKKINTKLYKELTQITLDGCYSEYIGLQGELQTFIETVAMKVPYPVSYEEVLDFKDICKLFKVHIDYQYDTLAEKLCGYVTLLSQLCGIQILFLVDIEKYLTKEEQRDLQQTANYHKIILIYVDAGLGHYSEDDRYCILDKDYCVISDMEK